MLIGLSGLTVGQKVNIPGEEITDAVKRFWRNGLFSNVSIEADSVVGGKVYLCIKLTQRPRVSQINYSGVKKGEREDLENRIGLLKDNQLTPNMIDRAKFLIKKYFDEKGYKNAEIEILQRDDVTAPDKTIVDIRIDKKEKVKIHSITIEGNHALSTKKIKGTMFVPGVFKKTNEKGRPGSWFRTKKFIEEKYKEDKENLIKKYNELGYRDAVILEDSVTPHNEKTVDVYVKVEEGQRYYLRNIEWVGNTIYPTTTLNNLLRMKKGDVYNQTKLEERTSTDEDAVGNLYYNNGYVFYRLDPVEVNIDGDSIDLELRITEGPQATIRHIAINGNDRVYESVVRRELRTKPGDLFSKEALERSYREIASMGHFDPEQIDPKVVPSQSVRWTSIGDWCRSRTTKSSSH
jgi:outer membrane protein insertion porin family